MGELPKTLVATEARTPSGTDQTRSAERRELLIYVVDDEPAVGELIFTMLDMEEMPSRVFRDPRAAFESFAAAQPRPNLLVTDFLMSPFNGMELIQRCKQLQPELRTILISGNIDAGTVEQFPVRPNLFIRKPFQAQVLIDAVRSLAGA